ncbi:MAG: ABC transporter ATP-binding protein [Coprothermobacterota bacterium]|nr:ABC transporter ATP-binding protein [Coprothermobacterota bacterium]
MSTVIETRQLVKKYKLGAATEVSALRGIDLQVEEGEFVAIMGPSGSGKSTLMNIIGCLDVPTSGTYRLSGSEVSRMSSNQLADLRAGKIGFIFQSFNLLPRTTALENVELPLNYQGVANARKRAEEALEWVGLSDRLHHRPNELSIGQQQRVAIARALVTHPSLILADEPTGNLDTRASEEIMNLLQSVHRQGGTLVLITHETEIGQHAQRVVRLRDGLLVSDETVTHPLDARKPVTAPTLPEQPHVTVA